MGVGAPSFWRRRCGHAQENHISSRCGFGAGWPRRRAGRADSATERLRGARGGVRAVLVLVPVALTFAGACRSSAEQLSETISLQEREWRLEVEGLRGRAGQLAALNESASGGGNEARPFSPARAQAAVRAGAIRQTLADVERDAGRAATVARSDAARGEPGAAASWEREAARINDLIRTLRLDLERTETTSSRPGKG